MSQIIKAPRNQVTMPSRWQSIAIVLSSGLISVSGPASTGAAVGEDGGRSGGGFDDIGKSPMFEVSWINRFVILQNVRIFVKQASSVAGRLPAIPKSLASQALARNYRLVISMQLIRILPLKTH